MSLIETKSRGQQAENLLRDEMLIEALREVRYAAHRAFENAGADPDKLDDAAMLLKAASTFQRFLTLAVQHGAAAAKQIDRDLQGGGWVRDIGRLVRNRDEMAEGMPWHQQR